MPVINILKSYSGSTTGTSPPPFAPRSRKSCRRSTRVSRPRCRYWRRSSMSPAKSTLRRRRSIRYNGDVCCPTPSTGSCFAKADPPAAPGFENCIGSISRARRFWIAWWTACRAPGFCCWSISAGDRHDWGQRGYYTQLQIHPLSAESADELLDSLLGTDAQLAPLKRLLIERTEGNPFFVEETVRTLIETGAIIGSGQYRSGWPSR